MGHSYRHDAEVGNVEGCTTWRLVIVMMVQFEKYKVVQVEAIHNHKTINGFAMFASWYGMLYSHSSGNFYSIS